MNSKEIAYNKLDGKYPYQNRNNSRTLYEDFDLEAAFNSVKQYRSDSLNRSPTKRIAPIKFNSFDLPPLDEDPNSKSLVEDRDLMIPYQKGNTSIVKPRRRNPTLRYIPELYSVEKEKNTGFKGFVKRIREFVNGYDKNRHEKMFELKSNRKVSTIKLSLTPKILNY